MHVLIIPSEHFVTDQIPLAGIFPYHQALLFSEKGLKTGIISAGLIPFSHTFKSYRYKEKTTIGNITVLRNYVRVFMPGRIALQLFRPLIIKLYLKLFSVYIENVGLPDIVHAHNCIYAGLAAQTIKQKYGIPYVITEHSSLYERKLVTKRQLRIAKEVFKEAGAKTSVSLALGKVLESKMGEVVNPIIPIFNVLDTEFCCVHGGNSKSTKDTIDILTIGSLDANKNHSILIKAFATAFSGKMKYRLLIGGSGDQRDSLELLSNKLNINSQVHFLGHLNREQVRTSMSSADVFVLTSNVETFGVVLIEALGLGIPVISTRSGGPNEIITENNGLLVPVGDQAELELALKYMVENLFNYDSQSISSECNRLFGRDAFYQRIYKIFTKVLTR